MEYKILEANGVENENVDGAAFNNFSSKGKNGIIRGILNECDVHLLNSSMVEISSGELLIQGFRIKIIEPYTVKRDASASSISHQLIARIRLSSDRSVSFEIECRNIAPLKQDSLFRNELGIYEVEIATFKTDQNGISNLIRILSIIDSRDELGTAGGRTGQVLKKKSDSDYDYDWEDEDTSLYTALSSEISKNRKRITNLELVLPEDCFQTDASVAYVKIVPANALPYAAISKIGGMSYKEGETLKSAPVTEIEIVGANLLPYPYTDTTKTVNGITFTDNGDGTITANGTATGDAGFVYAETLNLVGGKKYWFTGTLQYKDESGAVKYGSTSITWNASYSGARFYHYIASGTTLNNVTLKPMLNEGLTALPYAPYNKRTLLIPEAVLALDGYGDGVNDTCYNYIDWEKMQFVQCAKRHLIDGVTNKVTTVTKHTNGIYYAITRLPVAGVNYDTNMVNSHFVATDNGVVIGNSYITGSGNILAMINEDQSLTTPDAWNAWLQANPVTVVYRLATPEITDISNILTVDNLFPVEGGGTITMVNENGYAVPSEIIYQVQEMAE